MYPTADVSAPAPAALAVMIVHGTFPRGLWLQLRRNLVALWAGIRRRHCEEAALWPAPASDLNQRCWFESGSEFEHDLISRSGLPSGSIIFHRFLWSGRNTFAERTTAAHYLRAALREFAQEHPGVPHVVLAHSHGGTVAVKALDTLDRFRGGGETPHLRALLTLGTPFVRLAWRWVNSEAVKHRFACMVAMLLPASLLVLAPIMALQLGAKGYGIPKAVPIMLGIAALFAFWRTSVIGAVTIIAITVGLMGLEASLFIFAVLSVIVAAGISGKGSSAFSMMWGPFRGLFFLVSFLLGRRRLDQHLFDIERLNVGYWRRYVQEQPICLPCPLLALRTPGDEASLVIGLGQVVQGLWHVADRLFEPLRRARTALNLPAAPENAQRWRKVLSNLSTGLVAVLILAAVLLTLGAIVLHFIEVRYSGPEPTPFVWGTRYFFMGLSVVLGVLVAGLLTWVLPAIAVGLATGPESFMLPALTLVEAEPLPDARCPDGRPAEMVLEILYDARPTGLNHSLYEAPEVRERIATWLREQAGVHAISRP